MNFFNNFLNRIPRHLIVAASAWISRIITALISIISVRTLLLYLGEERYAVYAIAYSLSVWFFLCNAGLGAALQNFVSECRARSECHNRYLKAALQIICALLFVCLIILFLCAPFIQGKLFGNFSNIIPSQSSNIILVIGCIFILTAFANVVYNVYYALQKGYVSNILPAFASIISMTAIVLFNRYYPVKGNILAALLIFTVPQLLFATIPFIKIFKSAVSDILNFDYKTIKELATRAAKFAFPAVIVIFSLQIDYIIMSQNVIYGEIVTYNILNKVFMFFMMISVALMHAAWPIFSELSVKGQFLTIKKMIIKYIVFLFTIMLLGTALFWFFRNYIIGVLAPNTNIAPQFALFALFSAYYIARIFSGVFETFLSSINALKVFWISLPFQAVISITAQYFLSMKYGINGILLGLIIALLCTSCIALPYKTFKILRSK